MFQFFSLYFPFHFVRFGFVGLVCFGLVSRTTVSPMNLSLCVIILFIDLKVGPWNKWRMPRNTLLADWLQEWPALWHCASILPDSTTTRREHQQRQGTLPHLLHDSTYRDTLQRLLHDRISRMSSSKCGKPVSWENTWISLLVFAPHSIKTFYIGSIYWVFILIVVKQTS